MKILLWAALTVLIDARSVVKQSEKEGPPVDEPIDTGNYHYVFVSPRLYTNIIMLLRIILRPISTRSYQDSGKGRGLQKKNG